MKKQKRISATLVIALLALLLVLGGSNTALADSPYPQAVTSWQSFVLQSGTTSATAAYYGTAVQMVNYGTADCYVTTDVTAATSITPVLQSSPDNTNWSSDYTFAAISSDSTVMTRTSVYGRYQRVYVPMGTTNPVTVTARCIAKNS